MCPLRPGADQSSKAAFCKSAFAKCKLTFGKSAFSRSRFAFRQSIFASQKAIVWPSATNKILSAKTCQNVLVNIFCSLLDCCAPCGIFNKRKHVLAKAPLQKADLLDWSASGLRYLSWKCRIEREKFYPGPGLELGSQAFLVSLLTTELPRTSTNP